MHARNKSGGVAIPNVESKRVVALVPKPVHNRVEFVRNTQGEDKMTTNTNKSKTRWDWLKFLFVPAGVIRRASAANENMCRYNAGNEGMKNWNKAKRFFCFPKVWHD
jgi:hypothetical protein